MTTFRFPWDDAAPRPPAAAAPRPEPTASKPRRGRPKDLGRAGEILARRAAAAESSGLGAGEGALHHTEWQACVLRVSGPATALAAFAEAAAGAGITPWARDFAAEEEDLFYRLAACAPQAGRLSLEACRIFARQFRERLHDHHHRAVARVGHSRACPFDLHALLPVPAPLLALGAQHPDARRWLAAQWGTTELRKAWLHPGTARSHAPAALRYSFFAADTLPLAAVRRLVQAWPALSLDLHPEDGT